MNLSPELGCVWESRSALLRAQFASISSLMCLAKSLLLVFLFFVSERLLDLPVRPKHPMAKYTKMGTDCNIFAYGGRKGKGKGYGREREKEERAKVRERETLVF